MSDLKILVVEHSEIYRRSLALLINSFSGMQVVAECADAASALTAARELQPDVVVLNGELPGQSVVTLVQELQHKANALILARRFEGSLFRKLMQHKCKGFLLKSSSVDTFAAAIRTVATGKAYLDSDVVSECLDQVFTVADDGDGANVKKLSEREEQVLRMWVNGATSREIGEKLNRSSKTMDVLRARAFAKLGLKTRADAINYAIREGWLTPDALPEI